MVVHIAGIAEGDTSVSDRRTLRKAIVRSFSKEFKDIAIRRTQAAVPPVLP
jgi:hypothetical protein